jgi:hypothetical protein
LACNFLLLSSAHFHCLEEKPSAGCSESALEMVCLSLFTTIKSLSIPFILCS